MMYDHDGLNVSTTSSEMYRMYITFRFYKQQETIRNFGIIRELRPQLCLKSKYR